MGRRLNCKVKKEEWEGKRKINIIEDKEKGQEENMGGKKRLRERRAEVSRKLGVISFCGLKKKKRKTAEEKKETKRTGGANNTKGRDWAQITTKQ